MSKNGKGRGWHGEPGRHALAAQGVETSSKATSGTKSGPIPTKEIEHVIEYLNDDEHLPYDWKDVTNEHTFEEDREAAKELSADIRMLETEQQFDDGYGESSITLMANWAPLLRFTDAKEPIKEGAGKWYVDIFDCKSYTNGPTTEKEKAGRKIVRKIDTLGFDAQLVQSSGL